MSSITVHPASTIHQLAGAIESVFEGPWPTKAPPGLPFDGLRVYGGVDVVGPDEMIGTLPIGCVLSVAVGASFALAGAATLKEQAVFRAPAFWALLALELLLVMPVGAFLIWRFPGWSMMYLVEASSLPMAPFTLALAYPLLAAAAFLGGRHWITHERLVGAVALFLGGVAIAALMAFLGWEQLLRVGSTADYRADPTQLRDTVGSSLSYLLIAAGAAILISWISGLWRIYLLGRRIGAEAPVVAPTVLRSDSQKEPAAPAAGRKRKKAAQGS